MKGSEHSWTPVIPLEMKGRRATPPLLSLLTQKGFGGKQWFSNATMLSTHTTPGHLAASSPTDACPSSASKPKTWGRCSSTLTHDDSRLLTTTLSSTPQCDCLSSIASPKGSARDPLNQTLTNGIESQGRIQTLEVGVHTACALSNQAGQSC